MGGETFRVGLAALASSIHDRAFSDRSLLIKVRFVLPLSQIYIRMIFGWILALVRLRLNFPIPVHWNDIFGRLLRSLKSIFVLFHIVPEIIRKILQSELPCIIEGSMDDWPALADPSRDWRSVSYLKGWHFFPVRHSRLLFLLSQRVAEFRLVPVEIGSHYAASGWTQKLMLFGEFVDRFIVNQEHENDVVGYLAQTELFEQICEFKKVCCSNPNFPSPLNSGFHDTRLLFHSTIFFSFGKRLVRTSRN